MDSMSRCCEDATNRTRAGVMPRFAPRSSNAQNEATEMSGNVLGFVRSVRNAQNEPTASGHFRTCDRTSSTEWHGMARFGSLKQANLRNEPKRGKTKPIEANAKQLWSIGNGD